MSVKKGDVVLARVPHTAGTRGKKRPAVLIQANATTPRCGTSSSPRLRAINDGINDPACIFVDVTTADGQVSGLHRNGAVSCLHLVTMSADRLSPPVGRLSPAPDGARE